MEKEYITIDELCKIYSISRVTVYQWRKAGMPYEKIGKRMIRLKRDEVDKWIRTKA